MEILEEKKARDGRLGGVIQDSAAIPAVAGESRPRLLIAEDDLVIRDLLEVMFLQRGFDADCAVDGEEAIDLLLRKEYDLIMLDLQMPRKDGFEVTKAIRNRESARGTHMPIVALTAHAYQADQQKCIDAGMDAYIAKPFNFQELFMVIQGFINPCKERSKY